VSGKHIANYANLLKDSEEKYNSRFSALLKQGLRPEDYPVHFEEIRMRISGKSASEDKKLNESDIQVNKLSKEEFNNTTMNKPKSSSKGGNKKE
jgi:large subunit ribosomal protein L18